MYKVLYRKYRPQTFQDVVGQPQVTVTLKNELTRGRVAHAYLFTGSRGTGKTTCAKILARAVNCLHPKDGDPCGECQVCRGLEDGSILDVVEIDAASNNGVENVRSIIEATNFTPATAKYRVYIIDEVHMLSVQAFNALLKTLEEPPAHVVFILATTEVHKLPPTILSRCQRFDFHRIDPEQIAARLMDVAAQEQTRLDQDAALLIARVADGALRDALSLLDQCLGREKHVTLDVVYETAGLAARDYLGELAGAVADRDPSKALAVVDRLHRESKDLSRLCTELAEYFRGMMLCKTMRDPGNLISVSQEERQIMERQAQGMTLSDVLHGLDTFEETLNKMRTGSQRTQLEMSLVRLCCPELDSTPEALLRRIEALERGSALRPAPTASGTEKGSSFTEPPAPSSSDKENAFTSPSPKPAAPEPAPKAPAPPASAAAKSAPDIESLSADAQRFGDWPEILQQLNTGSKSVSMAFEGSRAYVSGDYLLIEAPSLAFELLRRPDQRAILREAVRQVTGRVYNLGPYKKSQKSDAPIDPLDDLMSRAETAGIPIEET